jgi:hypothetical protein
MRKKVKLSFINSNSQQLEVPLVIREHLIADLWYNKLKEFISTPGELQIETRFSGFKISRRSLPVLIEKLQRCVDGINNSWLNTEHGYRIEVDVIPPDYPTQVHNIIHHHFEILMGQTWKPSEWYNKIITKRDFALLSLVRGLNDISHEIEEFKVENKFPHLHTTFIPAPVRDELPIEAEDYFELGNSEGVVYLQYSQLGKTWVEVVYDEDEEIFESNISPLRLITGEFSMCFKGDGISPSDHLNYLAPKLKELGKDPTDKSLRLGRLVVADIEHSEIPKLITEIESGYDQLYSIELEDIIKVFPPYFDPY